MIVVYSEERDRFECISSYLERDIPKTARYRWDPATKRWWTQDEAVARRLAQYATGTAALRLNTQSPAERQAMAESMAEDAPDLDIPCPAGLAYLPYQRAGIAYMTRHKNTLLADDMGLGKTIQAIGLVNMLPDIRRVLIVVPASLRLNWMAEWRRWHTGRIRPTLLDTWPGGMFDHTEGRALIVSYDSVLKWHPRIAETEFDILIADEAHLVKDERSRRAKSLFGGNYTHKDGKGRVTGRTTFAPIQARRRIYMSGTPIVNRPEELWPLVKSLAPETLGANHRDFTERYGPAGRLGELHTRLRTQIMVRRKKDDVLKDLPAKRRQIVLLDIPDAAGFVAAEQNAVAQARLQLEQARREIVGLPHGEQVMKLRQCRAIAMSEMSRIRKESAVKKLPQAIEHIMDVLSNVDRLSVWAHHHEVTDALMLAFGRIAVGFDGRNNLAQRQEAVDRFQQGKARIFIGGIHAAGLGITLTSGSTAVFVEMDWTPARMTQAEDRHHRIGQHSPVLVQHLVVDGSIDSKMAKIILGKQAIMDTALDGGAPELRERDILEEVMAA
jgi:SWI/SNF-related matrix-associated actin-dependent regulator 1 of chromatin subfamily A